MPLRSFFLSKGETTLFVAKLLWAPRAQGKTSRYTWPVFAHLVKIWCNAECRPIWLNCRGLNLKGSSHRFQWHRAILFAKLKYGGTRLLLQMHTNFGCCWDNKQSWSCSTLTMWAEWKVRGWRGCAPPRWALGTARGRPCAADADTSYNQQPYIHSVSLIQIWYIHPFPQYKWHIVNAAVGSTHHSAL